MRIFVWYKTAVYLLSPVAQSVEQLAVNQLVGGSSPSRGASFQKCRFSFVNRLFFVSLVIFLRKKIKRFLVRRLEAIIHPDRVRKYKMQILRFSCIDCVA